MKGKRNVVNLLFTNILRVAKQSCDDRIFA